MMKQIKKGRLTAALLCLAAFVLWTALVRTVDLSPVGPDGSSVGFSTLNTLVHQWSGVRWSLYSLTDWLGLIPIATAMGFAALGLVQWITRRSLWQVDRDILALGVFYLAVMGVYLLFEVVTVNYRPVLINGVAEGSYPSSTTMLALCIMPTAAILLRKRILHAAARRWTTAAIGAFTAFMVVGRLLSGVHWVTDIIGGALVSAGLVLLYCAWE